MAQDVTEKEIKKGYHKPHSIDTAQFEYTATTMFTYGTIVVAALTLGVTYIYLLIQKVKT